MTERVAKIVRRVRLSKALWIPIFWLFIAGSRPVTQWTHMRVVGTGIDDQLEGSPIDRNVYILLILSAFVVLFNRRQKVAALVRANLPVLLFLLYCGVSIFWSDFPDVAFKRWIRAVGDITMVMVVLTDSSPPAAVRAFLSRTAFLIIPLSVLADVGRGALGLDYRFGLTMNKNMFGQISMILGLAAMWRFLNLWQGRKGKDYSRQLLMYGFMVAGVIRCLWSANSATSSVCFGVGTFLMVLVSRWPVVKKSWVLHFVVASLIFVVLYAAILNPEVGVASAMGKDPTLTGRTEVWKAVIPLNPSPWFGAGFESFWLGPRLKLLWSIFVWQPNEAHNGYVEVYLNLGWTGLILLALIIATGYRTVVNSLRHDSEGGSLRLAFFVVGLIYNLTEAGLRIFSPLWIVFLLSVTAVAVPKRQKARSAVVPARVVELPKAWA